MKNGIAWVLAAVFGLGAMTAAAADISLSGYGTVGYSQSDQSYNYHRFVNKQGTFKRDSVLGVQMDAKLSDDFGFTLQGKVAPSLKSETAIDATISWAFLSWRPTNDWLVRVGRIRVPIYLHSENMDVGSTFDFARLPAEVYTSAQTTDGDGIHIGKTWNMDVGELTLLGYHGSANTYYRFYRRDNEPSLALASGAYYVPVKMTANGLVLTLQRDESIFRVTAHDTYTKITDNQTMPVTFPYTQLPLPTPPFPPGIGYYQTSNLIPGPGVLSENNIHSVAYTLGADVAVGNGFRVTGEYVRRDVRNVSSGPDSQGGYLAVLKSVGAWTPYISVARLESMPRTRDLYNKVNNSTVPVAVDLALGAGAAAQLNASQRAGADGIMAYDQTTWALGTSYRINPTSKVKAEWARTQTGDMSSLIDALPGGESGKKVVNVLSFSYNFVF